MILDGCIHDTKLHNRIESSILSIMQEEFVRNICMVESKNTKQRKIL